MIAIFLYSTSIFVILILYYFYKPAQEQPQDGLAVNTSVNSQQLYDSLDAQNLPNQSDLLSLSSNTSGSLSNQQQQQLDNSNNQIQNHQFTNDSSVDININDLSAFNRNKKFSSCYTYTNYKQQQNGSSSNNNNNKKPLNANCSSYNRNDDALIVEFFRKYCNKNLLLKYLGLNSSLATASAAITDTAQLLSLNQQIYDSYKTFDDLKAELNNIGLVQYNLIVGIDFTASNEWKGRRTFNSQSLHKTLGNKIYNPYQKVLSIFGNVFNNMDLKIHSFGFGDRLTKDESVFSFFDYDDNLSVVSCGGLLDSFKSFDEVLQRYNSIVKRVHLSSPTSFAPIINKSVELVKKTNEYHILFIIADGKVNEENEVETVKAIENASNCALSIVMIGVGDGPWDTMIKFDDKLVNRKFDNFQFVDFHRVIRNSKTQSELKFALNALMEIPEQYKYCKKFGFV